MIQKCKILGRKSETLFTNITEMLLAGKAVIFCSRNGTNVKLTIPRENAITVMPAVELRFPHTTTKEENKHRPGLLVITRDWLLKHHLATHASAELDSYIAITSRD
ncbi:hypothetical protein TNCV_460731 [Trichonephila clavipes]|nr:hypothetical protein TNCV_460731 [Trichonephila clavipes]